ncbi:MAG: hypothetical protein IPI66_14135 [Chitinophagaceae bacterium]|nr:hypothetical protein [Chitinophagaceae bacterium]
MSSNKSVSTPHSILGSRSRENGTADHRKQCEKLLGTYWTYIDHGVDRLFKVMAFNNATLNYTVKQTKLNRDTKAYSYICYTEKQEIPAEDLLYVRPSSSYNLFKAQNTSTSCSSCGGSGTKTQNFSHTNDYQYTLGTKTTYTSTSKVKCPSCGGSVVCEPGPGSSMPGK